MIEDRQEELSMATSRSYFPPPGIPLGIMISIISFITSHNALSDINKLRERGDKLIALQ